MPGGSSSLPGRTSQLSSLCRLREPVVGSGELVSREQLARWQERGLIRAIPLRGAVRRARADDLLHSPIGAFRGFAPLWEGHDAVRVERRRSID